MFQVFCPVPKGRGGWSLRLKRAACGGLLGLACLNGVALPALADNAATQLPSQVHAFDIPAQRLSSALIAFGQQSGLQVTVDAQWLRDQQSNPVHGQLSSEGALARLLQGSGITWDYNGSVLTFRLLAEADAGKLELHDTLVLGGTEENSYQGATVINHQAVQSFPGANGDITKLLQMHPAVQFSSSQQSSNNPGEIDPADISINGAKFWQNNFMIDGISINNDLDPGAHGYGEARQFESAPSRSYGIALDADLLEEVKVYDSNVPAEYGGFNGGVIDSITRRPTEDFHGKISYSMSRSEWTRYHISEADQSQFDNSTDERFTPEFKKTTVRGILEGHVTDNFGAIFAFSQRRSVMPLNLYDNSYVSPNNDSQKDQERKLDSYMLKTYWDVNDRLSVETTLMKAPQENVMFRDNYLNSGFVNINGGQQGAIKAVWEGDHARWTHTLAVTDLYSSREADANETIQWYYSSVKNWGNPVNNTSRSGEGAFGSIDQTQKGLDYKLKMDWETVRFAGATHAFTAGIDLSQQKATWERPETGQSLSSMTRDAGTLCLGNDPYCSVGLLLNGDTRQWAKVRTQLNAGKIEVEESAWAIHAQDAMQIGKLGLRPGVRFEGDDYMDKKTVSPRFAGDYDFFGDRSTVLVFGVNRYYGRNLFKYRLADGRQALNTAYRRTTQGGAWTGTTNANSTRFSTVDIPYDDEWTLGLEQRWLDTDFKLKYVHRSGRDKIVKANVRTLGEQPLDGYILLYTKYTNEGSSDSDNLSLTVTPVSPIRFLNSYTSFQLALDWSRTKDAYGSYDSTADADEYYDRDVIYDGSPRSYSELPASDFNRPWTARLSTITEIPAWNLTISNFFRYRGAYDQIYNTGTTADVNGEALEVYDVASVQPAPTWDLRVKWEIPTAKDQALFMAVDVTNVTDQVNEIVSSGSSARTTYEVGRQYWLEVGYRF
ncbi:MAG: TonB-dependent receptor [Paucimonas sp.]|jgi:hypothetical protein|nr:TonB-dependent receptor [Paucimonas sp.]